MIYLISLIYTALIILIFGKVFKQAYLPILGVLLILFGVIEYVGGKHLSEMFGMACSYGFVQPISKAGIATALFFFVMMCPVLPSQLKITKYARQNRTQLAIMGCVLTFAHNIVFGFTGKAHFIQLFTNPAEMSPRMLVSGIISFIAVCMLIPLFITSLTFIRKQMKPSMWKNVQLLAYPYWILINAHALALYLFKIPQVWEKGVPFMIFNNTISIVLYGTGLVLWLALKLYKRRSRSLKAVPAYA